MGADCGIIDMCFMALMAPSRPGASFMAMLTSSRHAAFMAVMASSRRGHGLHVGDGVQPSRMQASWRWWRPAIADAGSWR
jgi:hypothetical protein